MKKRMSEGLGELKWACPLCSKNQFDLTEDEDRKIEMIN